MSLVHFNFLLLKVLTEIYIGHLPATFQLMTHPQPTSRTLFTGTICRSAATKYCTQDKIMTKHGKSLLLAFHRFKQTCSLLGLAVHASPLPNRETVQVLQIARQHPRVFK